MELQIFIADRRRPKIGQWFQLSSLAAEKLVARMKQGGAEPEIVEWHGEELYKKFLKDKPIQAINEWVRRIEDLPPQLIEEFPNLIEHEDLEEIIETEGSHFTFYEEDSFEDVAQSLVESREYERFMSEGDLFDYIDYEALGEDLERSFAFFEGYGGIIEYKGR